MNRLHSVTGEWEIRGQAMCVEEWFPFGHGGRSGGPSGAGPEPWTSKGCQGCWLWDMARDQGAASPRQQYITETSAAGHARHSRMRQGHGRCSERPIGDFEAAFRRRAGIVCRPCRVAGQAQGLPLPEVEGRDGEDDVYGGRRAGTGSGAAGPAWWEYEGRHEACPYRRLRGGRGGRRVWG